MYGHKPWLPIDLYFGTETSDMNAKTSTKFMQQLRERLLWTYNMAQQVVEKEHQCYNHNYNHKFKCACFKNG